MTLPNGRLAHVMLGTFFGYLVSRAQEKVQCPQRFQNLSEDWSALGPFSSLTGMIRHEAILML
jgi:hypothetical protein